MRTRGTLKTWNDERGFGFIEADETGAEIFVHIKAFASRSGRPQVGQAFFFDVEPAAHGRKRAVKVEPVAAVRQRVAQRRAAPDRRRNVRLVAIPVFAVVYLVVTGLTRAPLWFGAVYLLASAVTFVAYAIDKAAARREAQRIPESTLHTLALAGGWPGALLAQRFLRHKSAKADFLAMFWLTVVANAAGFVVLCYGLARQAP